MKTVLFFFLLVVTLAYTVAWPAKNWSPLRRRQNTNTNQQNSISQNINQNNVIFSTGQSNSVCHHGEEKCMNDASANGHNATAVCINDKWEIQQCPYGYQCIDNDWSCAHPTQASWVSTVYQKSQPTPGAYCPFGLCDHGCTPKKRPVYAYNSVSSIVAAVTIPTTVIYDVSTETDTETSTATTTAVITATATTTELTTLVTVQTHTATVVQTCPVQTCTASCPPPPMKTVMVEAPCIHGARKCTEKGIYTCVKGVWKGSLCGDGTYCVPHFYECLPFQPFVDAIVNIRNTLVVDTVVQPNQVVPYIPALPPGPTVITSNTNINQNTNTNQQNVISQNINQNNIIINVPSIVSVSTSTTTSTVTNNDTYTYTQTTTQNWTSTTTWSTTSTWTTTLDWNTTATSASSTETTNSTETSTTSSTETSSTMPTNSTSTATSSTMPTTSTQLHGI